MTNIPWMLLTAMCVLIYIDNRLCYGKSKVMYALIMTTMLAFLISLGLKMYGTI